MLTRLAGEVVLNKKKLTVGVSGKFMTTIEGSGVCENDCHFILEDGSYYVLASVRPYVRPLTFRVRSTTLIIFEIFSKKNLVQI